MNICYFDTGEARWMYGSAASLVLCGHNVYFIKLVKGLKKISWDLTNIEINTKNSIKLIELNTLNIPIENSHRTWLNFFYNYTNLWDYSCQMQEVIRELDPDILITASNNWKTGYSLSKEFKIPLIFWASAAAFETFKLQAYLKHGKKWNKLFLMPLIFIYNYIRANRSDYVLARDKISYIWLNKIGLHSRLVFPTYNRFKDKDAYSNFMAGEGSLGNKDYYKNLISDSIPYVLSVVSLQRGSDAYFIETKTLDFIYNIAIEMPNINFLIIGSSPDNIRELYGNNFPINFIPLGKIYDDSIIDDLYGNARCALAPIYIPGFTNRILEAFFYHKPIISSSLVAKSFDGLRNNYNIVFADTIMEGTHCIEKIIIDNSFRLELERNAREYYMDYLSPETHGKELGKLINLINKGRNGLI